VKTRVWKQWWGPRGRFIFTVHSWDFHYGEKEKSWGTVGDVYDTVEDATLVAHEYAKTGRIEDGIVVVEFGEDDE
jgi:hypothetical protein